MSLYSSLTQVLAPFAAKINGLLTGWDGTRYSTPGEAVRQQISDLHVLIGDEPGTAIQASAVAYEDSNVDAALDTVNGRLGQLDETVYTNGQECELRKTVTGYALDANGYRVTAEGYKLFSFRVAAGWIIKVASTHKFQFQSNQDVTASGTQYRIGPTYGEGEYVLTVPDEASFIVVSSASESETVYRAVSAITQAYNEVNAKAEDAQTKADYSVGNLRLVNNEIFPYGDNLTVTSEMSGYALDANGYRITQSGNKLMRFRVFAGNTIKFACPDKCQFQSTDGVPATGTQYKIGPTYGIGEYVFEVPEGATYLIISTTDNVNVTVARVDHFVDSLNDEIDGVKTNLSDNELNFSAVLNAYTSQVSDIPYPWSVTHITIGIDTTNEKFISGSGHALVLPIISGTSIRVKKPQTGFCQICFASDYPTANVDITHRTNKNSVGNIEFVAESQATDNYLVIYTHSTEIAVADCIFSYSQTARGTVELLPQLDKYMINLLKYRPVGKISKPYIAISCDDGLEPLATYTLPRIQYWNEHYGTNIPLHMALFDGSPVLTNPEYAALVTDMCVNHNCSIGVHGTQSYTAYSSSTALYAYLKKQYDTIVNVTGVTPTSVLYPQGDYTDEIMVMCGGFCGICAMGGDVPPTYKYTDESGRYFYVGEKTNLYELNRFNISDTRINSPEELKRVIDYAFDHNLTLCPYFHDIDFTEHTEAANQFARTMFDTLIQYGMEKGIEFINLGDIRFLT